MQSCRMWYADRILSHSHKSEPHRSIFSCCLGHLPAPVHWNPAFSVKTAAWWLWAKCGNEGLESWRDWCGGCNHSWQQFHKEERRFSGAETDVLEMNLDTWFCVGQWFPTFPVLWTLYDLSESCGPLKRVNTVTRKWSLLENAIISIAR